MMPPKRDSIFPNLFRYQLTWLATVWGAAHGKADLGAFIGFLMIVLHFKKCHHLLAEYKTVFTTLLIGGLWELILVKQQWVVYEGTSPITVVPLWILVLWTAFGATLNGCLGWFKHHLGWSFVFGALGGPLAWYGGAALGALRVTDPVWGYGILSAGWAVMMPLLSYLARYYTLTSEFIDEEVGRGH